ncbi:diacylglycerol/lipid kinase family protein [Celeribacter indicus]|uniref:Diacylglycerol kinase catalytic subunit n=1 Tax=Celeribacter indicus TaxID=1208324 RepID=A0A0B5E5L4_9RHOB|nr:diacylglycerol kinase family protein [Celeribacter indicus]AJE47632.1 diacylglycerol kinase catalytic subunit [Celeribacter indicus]SDW12594.1 Diacylglycerol kinase family enzyme [Celeribacter indicus]
MISIVANEKSGTNARDAEALERACAEIGGNCRVLYWDTDADLGALIDAEIAQGATTIVAAGGDGTVMAVAGAMLGKEAAMGVLPLGTFNFFARGLGLSEVPEEAARQIVEGVAHDIAVGTVNGKVFLNNTSLGVYPAILKSREDIYARWGRRRIVAHWSVVKTILRFQRPMRLTITADGTPQKVKTPLVFVARSAYQLGFFGLDGAEAISADGFAVFIIHAASRAALLRLAFQLATRQMPRREDFTLIEAKEVQIRAARPRVLVAFDGEKAHMASPVEFHMAPERLRILLPQVAAAREAV